MTMTVLVESYQIISHQCRFEINIFFHSDLNFLVVVLIDAKILRNAT